MTWVRIDDDFAEHAKVENLSDAALALWVRANCWCHKKKNAYLNGFVPRSSLRKINQNRLTQEETEALAQELVNANVSGTKEQGLWEPVEGGWKFHDWHNYQLERRSNDVESFGNVVRGTMSRSEAARLAGLASAASRREKFGNAQPKFSNEPNDVRTTLPNDVAERRSNVPEPPDPDPVREILPEKLLPKTCKNGNPDGRYDNGNRKTLVDIPCPVDLKLNAGQRGGMEMCGAQDWQIDALEAEFRMSNLGDPNKKMPLAKWQMCIGKAVQGQWNSGNRPKKTEETKVNDDDRPRPKEFNAETCKDEPKGKSLRQYVEELKARVDAGDEQAVAEYQTALRALGQTDPSLRRTLGLASDPTLARTSPTPPGPKTRPRSNAADSTKEPESREQRRQRGLQTLKDLETEWAKEKPAAQGNP